ncbi:MAG: hypothetical protein HS104_42420 [Polyangiaceae bacterium]|nr:hypothetical protein [Polyangiaceae bacterium]
MVLLLIAWLWRSEMTSQRHRDASVEGKPREMVLADPLTHPEVNAREPSGGRDAAGTLEPATADSACKPSWEVTAARPCSASEAHDWIAGIAGMGACVALADVRRWSSDGLEIEVSVPEANQAIEVRYETPSAGAASFARCLRTMLRHEERSAVRGCRISVHVFAPACNRPAQDR